MELTAIIFYLLMLLTLGSAAFMVFSRNIVHAAFALMFALLGVAGLYVLLYADFLAVTQILVYVGGILILVLFGIMLTTRGFTDKLRTVTVNLLPAGLLMLVLAGVIIYVFATTGWVVSEPVDRDGTITEMGFMLMQDYILPFQVAGVLLLVAIIGALLMATRVKDSTE